MKKKDIIRKIISSLAFGIGIVIIICMIQVFNTNTEEVSNSSTIEDLEWQIEQLEEKLGYEKNQYEELKKEYEEAKDVIELLRTQLEELNMEPYEL